MRFLRKWWKRHTGTDLPPITVDRNARTLRSFTAAPSVAAAAVISPWVRTASLFGLTAATKGSGRERQW